MKEKKIPQRMCLGCQQMKPKNQMVRIVKNKEAEVCVDLTGKKAGRGAYLCNNKDCIEKAKKARRLEKAFETKIAEEIFQELIMQTEITDE